MNTWKVILATMVIFATGVVTGGLLVEYSTRSNVHRPPRLQNASRPGQPVSTAGVARIEFLRRLGSELDLTPEQHQAIDKILADGQERMKKLLDTIEPRRRQELRLTMDEFRQVLTPEQRTHLDQLLKQQQQKRSRDQHKQQPSPEQAPGQVAPAAVPTAATNP